MPRITTTPLLDGLSLERGSEVIDVIYPAHLHPLSHAAHIAGGLPIKITDLSDRLWKASFPMHDDLASNTTGYPESGKRFFARLNGFPDPYTPRLSEYKQPTSPVLSCIIVLNENLPFLQEQLIPSLLANSDPRLIEIIVVWNGTVAPGAALDPIRTVSSHGNAVSTAYNKGVEISHAPLLAIFHDDVIIDDPEWIAKSLVALKAGAAALSPEIRQLDQVYGISFPRLPIAKNVPLILARETYDRVGGYDENHFIGYEDLDFTLSLLIRNLKVHNIELKIRHFHGMSSTIKYNNINGLAELYAFTVLPGYAIQRHFVEFVERTKYRKVVDWLQLSKDIQLLYVLNKYKQFLFKESARPYHRLRLELERNIRTINPNAIEQGFEYLEHLDRVSSSSVLRQR